MKLTNNARVFLGLPPDPDPEESNPYYALIQREQAAAKAKQQQKQQDGTDAVTVDNKNKEDTHHE